MPLPYTRPGLFQIIPRLEMERIETCVFWLKFFHIDGVKIFCLLLMKLLYRAESDHLNYIYALLRISKKF